MATGESLYGRNRDMGERGDVRVITPDKKLLMGRLAMVDVVSILDIEDRFPNIRHFYETTTMRRQGEHGLATVPDPSTYRPMTEEEFDYYVHEEKDLARCVNDPRNLVIIPAGSDAIPYFDHFSVAPHHADLDGQPDARTFSPPNMLTTTTNRKTGMLEGLHWDSGKLHTCRLGVNWGKLPRGFLAGVKSAQLLNEQFDFPVSRKRAWRNLSSEQVGGLGPIIRIAQKQGDAYIATTGSKKGFYHDGTTLLGYGEEAADTLQEQLENYMSDIGFFILKRPM